VSRISRLRPAFWATDALYHCVYALHYHLVIVTKYRRRVLTKAMLDRFDELARERVEAWGGRLVEVNGEPEHVHMLMTLPPTAALSDFVNALKTGTSRRLRAEFAAEVNLVYRKPVLWSRSYCVISCGGAPLSILKHYIENQERPE
jgi:putative transposase